MVKIEFFDLHYLRQYPQVLVNQLNHTGDVMYGKLYVFQLGRRVRLSFYCDLKKKVYHCECYYYGSRSPFSTYTRNSFSELRQTLFDSLL